MGYIIVALFVVGLVIYLVRVYMDWNYKRQDKRDIEDDNRRYYSVLDNSPKAIEELNLKTYTGVVTGVKINTAVTGPSFNIKTIQTKEIYFLLPDGKEQAALIKENILVNEGQTITLVKAYFQEDRFIWVYYYNHSLEVMVYFDIYFVLRNVTKKLYVNSVFIGPNADEHASKFPDYLADKDKLLNKIKQATIRTPS